MLGADDYLEHKTCRLFFLPPFLFSVEEKHAHIRYLRIFYLQKDMNGKGNIVG